MFDVEDWTYRKKNRKENGALEMWMYRRVAYFMERKEKKAKSPAYENRNNEGYKNKTTKRSWPRIKVKVILEGKVGGKRARERQNINMSGEHF